MILRSQMADRETTLLIIQQACATKEQASKILLVLKKE